MQCRGQGKRTGDGGSALSFWVTARLGTRCRSQLHAAARVLRATEERHELGNLCEAELSPQ